MADWIGLDLWGSAPGGYLRVAKKGEPQPAGVMRHEEIIHAFTARFDVVPVRKGGVMVKVVEKQEVPA